MSRVGHVLGWSAWGVLGSVVLACGPSAPSDGSGSGAASSSGPPSSSSGPTATGATTRPADGTGSSTSTSTSSTSSETSGTTGSTYACADDPPAMVPEPPPGCQHHYLQGPDGVVDRTRPAGYWACDDFTGPEYRVAAVACNCEVFHPLCADGTPEDCNGEACGPGQSCVDYFGNGYCGCLAQCNQDSDCGRGEICLCAGGAPGLSVLSQTNLCVPADCTVEGECAGQHRCKVSRAGCGTVQSVHCTTPSDDCDTAEDCARLYCAWDDVDELWTCDPGVICE